MHDEPDVGPIWRAADKKRTHLTDSQTRKEDQDETEDCEQGADTASEDYHLAAKFLLLALKGIESDKLSARLA